MCVPAYQTLIITPECASIPSPVEFPAITDRVFEETHSGEITLDALSAIDTNLYEVATVELLSGRLDDFGTLGGVPYQNNTPCVPGPGEISEAMSGPVNFTLSGNNVVIPWTAESDPTCAGGKTGIVDMIFTVTYQMK